MSYEKTGRPVKERLTPLGRRVYDLRTAKGWTLEKLAEKSGLCTRTISSVERGHDPTLFSAMCLADALGVTLDYLAKGKGNPTAT